MISPPEALAGARSRDTLAPWYGWLDVDGSIAAGKDSMRPHAGQGQITALSACACMPGSVCLASPGRLGARARNLVSLLRDHQPQSQLFLSVQPSNRDRGRARRVRVLRGGCACACACVCRVREWGESRVSGLCTPVVLEACPHARTPGSVGSPVPSPPPTPLHWLIIVHMYSAYSLVHTMYTNSPVTSRLARPEKSRYSDVM